MLLRAELVSLRAETIARRKQRELVLDDFSLPAPATETAEPFTYLAVLRRADEVGADAVGTWSPTAQVLYATALALTVAGLFAAVWLARIALRLVALVIALAARAAPSVLRALAGPVRFMHSPRASPARRPYRRRVRL